MQEQAPDRISGLRSRLFLAALFAFAIAFAASASGCCGLLDLTCG